MTNKKSTKRALLLNALSLLMCVSMLVGSTFAWFTDEVKSGSNVITAGNLDIDVEYTLDGETWKPLDGADDLFKMGLWEPGHTEVVALKVTNNGTLALKYTASMNIVNEVVGENADGEEIVLSDILQVTTITQEANEIGDILLGMLFAGSKNTDTSNTKTFKSANILGRDKELLPGASHYIGITVDMPETVGNEANAKDQDSVPYIEFGINVLATQYTYENDSFGNNYDADAQPVIVFTAEELAAALTGDDESISVILGNDIDLPISSLGAQTPGSGEYKLGGADTKAIIIDLGGNKLNITTTYWSALGANNADATFTIKNGAMTSSQATGTWNSYDLTFSNCNYVFENVEFEKAVALTNEGKSATLKNVTINETHDYYALWITAEGQTVSIDGLTVNSLGRGIKIDEQYVSAPAKVTLSVSNATINTNKKAAIMVKSAAGADIILNNVDISNTPDATHAVWVDEDSAAYYDLVTVTGGEKIYEGDMTTSASDLQAALDAATDGTVINLGAKITGNVTVTQKADVKITINGNGNTFNGTLLVDGKSATYTSAGLTIKNIKFVGATADACIQLGKDNLTRYTCNVTVENCTFDAPGKVGVKSYTGGDKNLTITGCTATANAHSLVQAKGIDGVLVESCNVYSKNGLNFNNSDNVVVRDCDVDVKGYAVRFGESSGGSGAAEIYSIEDCTLKSANDDGDATIVLRGTADNSTLTIKNTTISGDPDIANTAAGATIVK